jgi:hypothetical protein
MLHGSDDSIYSDNFGSGRDHVSKSTVCALVVLAVDARFWPIELTKSQRMSTAVALHEVSTEAHVITRLTVAETDSLNDISRTSSQNQRATT